MVRHGHSFIRPLVIRRHPITARDSQVLRTEFCGTMAKRPSRAIAKKHNQMAVRRHLTTAANPALKPIADYQHETKREPPRIPLQINQQIHFISPILLRDLDQSKHTLDPSTNQKSIATSEITASIVAEKVDEGEDGVRVTWTSERERGEDERMTAQTQTFVDWATLRSLATIGKPAAATSFLEDGLPVRKLWDASGLKEKMKGNEDISFEAYMQDDAVLLDALQRLHTHGILFLTSVPSDESTVKDIAQRIGPLKNTFYGETWDVRSVAEAKNVAYTAVDLGFHMDLLYMRQPPHLQFLHCLRSSTAGGASLFADAYRVAEQLYASSPDAFAALAELDVNFHYNHPSSHLYRQARQVFEFRPLAVDGVKLRSWGEIVEFLKSGRAGKLKLDDLLDAVSWSPPFQAPFALNSVLPSSHPGSETTSPLQLLSEKVGQWHAAAQQFSRLVHHPDAIYERTMRPGECVIFDNRRVLHARRAFEVGDFGLERWLRGAYLDKDPYLSKMAVLRARFGQVGE